MPQDGVSFIAYEVASVFPESYGEIFEKADEIFENAYYKVNKTENGDVRLEFLGHFK